MQVGRDGRGQPAESEIEMRKVKTKGGCAAAVMAVVAAVTLSAGSVGVLAAPAAVPHAPQSVAVEPALAVPDNAVVRGAGVLAAAASVVWVGGCDQDACTRYTTSTDGSGWVIAPERVVTNAHIVSVMRTASVRIGGVGRSYTATVVIFDPKRDLAVLSVPGLPAPALRQGADLQVGDPAVIAGFPGGGHYLALPARVQARGPITINDGRTEGRDSYQLRGYAAPGSSGGPLLSPSGQVVGIVYAGAADYAHVSALTLAEARPVLDAAARSFLPVSTRG
jgi:S1-C subfamily serine protease